MTLKVKIYERVFDVTYPSEKRVQDLMLEFATQCKGAIKPGVKRRFFVCIHCGKADFSNKMRLNQHMFLIGCGNAKFPDGVLALLLPYPDFESGQGKKVEVMRMGVADQGAKKRKVKAEDSLHVDTSGTVDDKMRWTLVVPNPPSSQIPVSLQTTTLTARRKLCRHHLICSLAKCPRM